MKLVFLGAAHEVTGSCSLLEVNGKKILIDCGMEQGRDIYENCDLPVAPMDIDAIFLTHAHIDHSGKIPAMVANGFKGPIYSSYATFCLCEIMLRDSAHIQEFEAEWRNRKSKRSGGEEYVPLYTMTDVEQTIKQFRYASYHETLEPFENIKATFFDAGHLLGSSSVRFELCEDAKTISLLFSGDLGNIDRPLINDPELALDSNYVVIESTYGNRLHGERPDYTIELTRIIQDAFDRGGNVVIPSFAVGRTQELLYLIRNIKEQGLVKNHGDFPVFVDSPLAVEATNIYNGNLNEYYDKETLELLLQGIDPINFSGLNLSITSDDSKLINADTNSKVIISASGMCEAGRIRHHLKHNLWRADSTILFVGYQSEGTVGRKLVDGADKVTMFGEEIAVKAKIETLQGISGHADRDMLLGWLGNMTNKPKTVFVNHGNDTVCDEFCQSITEELGFNAVAPYSGDKYDLATGECVEKGKIVKIEKKTPGRENATTVYSRLLDVQKRLASVIAKADGMANKDIARLADQISALCEKYDK